MNRKIRKYENGKTVLADETEEMIQARTERQQRQFEIDNLKEQIKTTDYKIIKCYEYGLVNQILPYDINELHTNRQALRDKINELEGGDDNNVA